MKLFKLAKKYGPRATASVGGVVASVSAFAVDPETAALALSSLSGSTTAFGPPLFGLAVASSVILIGVAWIKKGRGAAK